MQERNKRTSLQSRHFHPPTTPLTFYNYKIRQLQLTAEITNISQCLTECTAVSRLDDVTLTEAVVTCS